MMMKWLQLILKVDEYQYKMGDLLSIRKDFTMIKIGAFSETTMYLVVGVICCVLFWQTVYDEKRDMD
jgi:hypothetical protein